MLYHLLDRLAESFSALNAFRYITSRTGAAILTSLLISFVLAPPLIAWFKKLQRGGQPIREDGPPKHIALKAGTPTMGGLLILSSAVLSTALWADVSNIHVQLSLLVMVLFGLVGLLDDVLKVRSRSNYGGISVLARLGVEFLIAFLAVSLLVHMAGLSQELTVPFFKNILIPLGFFFPVFGAFVVVGTANAVNLTDGLDGLAIVPVMMTAATFGAIVYLAGNAVFSSYLQIHHVPGTGELAVFCGSLIGAGLGFLWFNAPPARVFMGDTGSLALGASLGFVSVAARHEIVLAIAGGLFVLETLSVIAQVVSFKLTGRRVFRMAPFHHHLEQKGWAEATIVIRLWIISFVLSLLALSTLKLR